MTATTAFGLQLLGRATVDDVEYVVYSDGQFADAVPASEYDHVDASWAATGDHEHASEWTAIGADQVPAEVRAELDWLLD